MVKAFLCKLLLLVYLREYKLVGEAWANVTAGRWIVLCSWCGSVWVLVFVYVCV